MPNTPLTTCLFCGKTNLDGLRLVATQNATAAICGPCVLRCSEILILNREDLPEPVVVPTPEGEALASKLAGGAPCS